MFSSKSARSSDQVLRGMEAFLSVPIQTILSDNGSEFEGEFARVAADKGITRFYTHPNCPQQNAVNERFNRTLREAFLETHEDWIDDLQQMNEALADWLTGYNGFRPHRSLNRPTPLTRFYNSTNGHLGARPYNFLNKYILCEIIIRRYMIYNLKIMSNTLMLWETCNFFTFP